MSRSESEDRPYLRGKNNCNSHAVPDDGVQKPGTGDAVIGLIATGLLLAGIGAGGGEARAATKIRYSGADQATMRVIKDVSPQPGVLRTRR